MTTFNEVFGANDGEPWAAPTRALIEGHAISTVHEDHCDYPAEVRCQCGWEGRPDEHAQHVLFLLGVTSTEQTRWNETFGRARGAAARQYGDIVDDPRAVRARKTIETKERKAQRLIEKLDRMAANGAQHNYPSGTMGPCPICKGPKNHPIHSTRGAS